MWRVRTGQARFYDAGGHVGPAVLGLRHKRNDDHPESASRRVQCAFPRRAVVARTGRHQGGQTPQTGGQRAEDDDRRTGPEWTAPAVLPFKHPTTRNRAAGIPTSMADITRMNPPL